MLFSLCVTLWPDSSKGHSHSHPTVTHSAVGPMYAMGTQHHQGTDGMTEKKKKKEEKDREKHEKEKDKVTSNFATVKIEVAVDNIVFNIPYEKHVL